MKKVLKVLKWTGIIFIGLILIGIFFSDDETTSEKANNKVSTEESNTKTSEEVATNETSEELNTEEEETTTTNSNNEEEEEEKNEKKEEKIETTTYAEYADYHIPLLSEDTLELSKESFDFIAKNHKLFPAMTEQDIQNSKNMTDNTISIKHLNKNASPYLTKVLSFTGTVISIEESPIEDTSDTVAIIHVLDDEGNSYQVLLYKTTGDILEEDYVQFWGAPVGPSYFENVSGGTTNVQLFMGSHIEKAI